MRFIAGKLKILSIISGIGFLAIIGLLTYMAMASEQIVINEVCSNNFSVIYDESGEYSDYIELYNPTPVPVSLSGYSLSDSLDDLKKCNLDSVILGPKSYMLIYADARGASIVGHTSFKLAKQGEEIFLSNSKGEIIDSINVPELAYNTSYARIQDAEEEWERQVPSPQMTNNDSESVVWAELDEPTFSCGSGFYEQPFELTLTAKTGETIYYTLDGSEPTKESLCYEKPILIDDASQNENMLSARQDLVPKGNYIPEFKVDKAAVVRAIAYNEETGSVSEIGTKTYFVNYEGKTEYENLPIVSIVTDPDNLFDNEYGIYGNGKEFENYVNNGGMKDGELLASYTDENGEEKYLYMASNAFRSGKEWEREAVIEYFDENHESKFSQEVGIRISGQSTRRMAQKSFNVYARDIYDDGMEFPVFFWNDEKLWSSVKLRNGGSDNRGSKIKDPFLQKLAEERDVSIQKSMPCVVFLNGEYWGIYNLRERYKEEYFYNYFGVNSDDVWMIDSGASSIGEWDAWNNYQAVLDFAEQNDLSDENNYAEMCQLIDVQSLIDFYCINLYIDNVDMAFDKNMALWRSVNVSDEEYKDGRWRWMLYDVDLSLGDYTRNTFEESESWKEDFDLLDEVLIKELLKNEEFRKQFCLSFMDIANETYAYDRVHQELVQWSQIYKEQVIKDYQRFQSADIGEEEYDSYIAEMDDFFKYRNDYMSVYLAGELGLTGTKEKVVLKNESPEGGSIVINTLNIGNAEEWQGDYYTDYSITVAATAEEGYCFKGWSGDIESETQTLEITVPSGGLALQAEFVKVNRE